MSFSGPVSRVSPLLPPSRPNVYTCYQRSLPSLCSSTSFSHRTTFRDFACLLLGPHMAILSGSFGRQTRSILSTTGLAALISLSLCFYLLSPAQSQRHDTYTATGSDRADLQTDNGFLEQHATNTRQGSFSSDNYAPSFVFDYEKHQRHHAMTDEQCDASFPFLFDTLYATASTRSPSKIELSEISIDSDKCLVRVLVYQSEVRLFGSSSASKH